MGNLHGARELLDGSVEKAGIRQPKPELLPGAEINFAAVSSDVNTFVGYSLFSRKRKHGVIEELVTGIDEEVKYWLLTDMMFLEGSSRLKARFATLKNIQALGGKKRGKKKGTPSRQPQPAKCNKQL